MFFDRVAFVSALQKDVPSVNKETFMPYSGFVFGGIKSAAIKINIQPASPELTAVADGQMFKTYQAFTTASGLTEGMTVTISGTNTIYRVRGREPYDYGQGQHYEVTLVKSDTSTP